MNKFLKLSMIAAMAIAVTACGDDKDNSKKCTNGAKQCSTAGIPELCVDGAWKAQTACTGGQTCNAGVCTGGGGTCTNGAKQCTAAGLPQLCVEGAWADQTACAADQTCDAGECKGGGSTTCTNGAKQCTAAGLPQLCVEGAWADQTACAADQTCDAGECKGGGSTTCTNNAKQCSASGVPQLCVSGAWADQAACSGGQTCAAGACTGGTVGASCDEKSFEESCIGNGASWCNSKGEVAIWECDEDWDEKCLVIRGTSTCGWLDDGYCDYDGEVLGVYSDACEDFSYDGTIYYDFCHKKDGEMYIIEDWWAESICFENSKLSCISDTQIKEEKCDGDCSFDGWNAVCK